MFDTNDNPPIVARAAIRLHSHHHRPGLLPRTKPARWLGWWLVAALALPALHPARAADSNGVCRATLTGSTGLSGATWSQALDLRSALADPSCHEIWVRAGVYMPSTTENPTESFKVRPGVAVYGGFVGNAMTREARDR